MKWDYKVETLKHHEETGEQEKHLKQLGKEGWELVNIAVYPYSEISGGIALAYLKKEE